MTSPAQRSLAPAFLIVLLALNFCGAFSSRAGDTNLVSESAADREWLALKHASETPPEPLRQNPDRMLTQEEITGYYRRIAGLAGAVADSAKEFYTRHPTHAHAADAEMIYFDMLHTAVGLSSTNKIAELQTVTAERQKNSQLDDAARFQLSLRLLQSLVSGRQYESDEAMRAELEIRARQLARDYPDHPEGINFLLNLAREAALEKSVALARDILASSRDPIIKEECQGIINRAAALGKPLNWKLAMRDGATLDFATFRGHPVVLLFWDSTNRFSAKALWAVNELRKTYAAQGLKFVGLNFDEKQEASEAMLKEQNVEWPQYFDLPAGGPIQKQFGIHSLPMCWLVDKKGVLRELKAQRSPDQLVQELLAEKE